MCADTLLCNKQQYAAACSVTRRELHYCLLTHFPSCTAVKLTVQTATLAGGRLELHTVIASFRWLVLCCLVKGHLVICVFKMPRIKQHCTRPSVDVLIFTSWWFSSVLAAAFFHTTNYFVSAVATSVRTGAQQHTSVVSEKTVHWQVQWRWQTLYQLEVDSLLDQDRVSAENWDDWLCFVVHWAQIIYTFFASFPWQLH